MNDAFQFPRQAVEWCDETMGIFFPENACGQIENKWMFLPVCIVTGWSQTIFSLASSNCFKDL